MPELPRVAARRTIAALQRAGFVQHHETGSHAVLVNHEQRRTAIVPRHGGHDLPVGTLHSILKQAGLTVEQFLALLN